MLNVRKKQIFCEFLLLMKTNIDTKRMLSSVESQDFHRGFVSVQEIEFSTNKNGQETIQIG